jgi:hypothetical protein
VGFRLRASGFRERQQRQQHTPNRHTAPLAHAFPHAPQFAGSVDVSTHAPAHVTCPDGQLVPHTPLEQIAPGEHTLPHEPQWDGSVARSTHAVPHIA